MCYIMLNMLVWLCVYVYVYLFACMSVVVVWVCWLWWYITHIMCIRYYLVQGATVCGWIGMRFLTTFLRGSYFMLYNFVLYDVLYPEYVYPISFGVASSISSTYNRNGLRMDWKALFSPRFNTPTFSKFSSVNNASYPYAYIYIYMCVWW